MTSFRIRMYESIDGAVTLAIFKIGSPQAK